MVAANVEAEKSYILHGASALDLVHKYAFSHLKINAALAGPVRTFVNDLKQGSLECGTKFDLVKFFNVYANAVGDTIYSELNLKENEYTDKAILIDASNSILSKSDLSQSVYITFAAVESHKDNKTAYDKLADAVRSYYLCPYDRCAKKTYSTKATATTFKLLLEQLRAFVCMFAEGVLRCFMDDFFPDKEDWKGLTPQDIRDKIADGFLCNTFFALCMAMKFKKRSRNILQECPTFGDIKFVDESITISDDSCTLVVIKEEECEEEKCPSNRRRGAAVTSYVGLCASQQARKKMKKSPADSTVADNSQQNDDFAKGVNMDNNLREVDKKTTIADAAISYEEISSNVKRNLHQQFEEADDVPSSPMIASFWHLDIASPVLMKRAGFSPSSVRDTYNNASMEEAANKDVKVYNQFLLSNSFRECMKVLCGSLSVEVKTSFTQSLEEHFIKFCSDKN